MKFKKLFLLVPFLMATESCEQDCVSCMEALQSAEQYCMSRGTRLKLFSCTEDNATGCSHSVSILCHNTTVEDPYSPDSPYGNEFVGEEYTMFRLEEDGKLEEFIVNSPETCPQ